jgi:hypothetical protein
MMLIADGDTSKAEILDDVAAVGCDDGAVEGQYDRSSLKNQ